MTVGTEACMSRWFRDHYEWLLTLMWEDFLEVEEISVQNNFFELGGTNKSHEEMLRAVSARFNVTPSNEPTASVEDLASNVHALRNSLGLKQKPYFIPGSGAGSKACSGSDSVPLIFLHGVAGETMYDPKLLRFNMGRPIVSIRSVGMDLEESPLTTVESMVQRYVADLAEIGVYEPYIIAGSSCSAVIALAMAHWLEEHGKTVAYAGLLEPFISEHVDSFQVAVARRLEELCLFGEVEFYPNQNKLSIQALRNAAEIPPSYSDDLVMRHAEVFAYNLRATFLSSPRRFNGHAVLYESRDFGCGPEPLGSLDVPREKMQPYEQFWSQFMSPQTMVRRQNCDHRSLDQTLLMRTWLRDDINEALRAVS
jgi:thioesterase domain-containing protein